MFAVATPQVRPIGWIVLFTPDTLLLAYGKSALCQASAVSFNDCEGVIS